MATARFAAHGARRVFALQGVVSGDEDALMNDDNHKQMASAAYRLAALDEDFILGDSTRMTRLRPRRCRPVPSRDPDGDPPGGMSRPGGSDALPRSAEVR
jgi:hypothetical protein